MFTVDIHLHGPLARAERDGRGTQEIIIIIVIIVEQFLIVVGR